MSGDDASPATDRGEAAPPIRLRDVVKRYDGVVALDGVDLTVEPGTVHCLVGPNGSGKTTLLRLILGLTRPTAGTVDVPDARLGVAFQRPSHYEALTVGENIDVFAALADADSGWVERAVEHLRLDRVRHRTAGDLSGGWSRKLDVALALVKEPDFLLLDEPLADLDDVTRRRLAGFLGEYRDAGHAVLVSTHSLGVFEAVLDRLTVVSDGRVLSDEGRADLPAEDVQSYYVDRVLAADGDEGWTAEPDEP